MVKEQKKSLFTPKDKAAGLAEKRGLNLGSIMSEKDRRDGLFTPEDKKGLM